MDYRSHYDMLVLWLAVQMMSSGLVGARPGQTELERATELGLYRVYDCGKKTWVWTR